MKISLLDCGKWAVTQDNHIVAGLVFDTHNEAQEFLFVLRALS